MPSVVRAVFRRAKILGQRLVIGVLSVRLDRGDDRRRPDKARNVVHVPVGVVAGNSPPQPDHLLDAEVIVEGAFKFFAAHTGIALLHFAQQTFFRRQQNALAVGIDRSALKDEPALLAGNVDGSAAIEAIRAIQLRDREPGRQDASPDTWPTR